MALLSINRVLTRSGRGDGRGGASGADRAASLQAPRHASRRSSTTGQPLAFAVTLSPMPCPSRLCRVTSEFHPESETRSILLTQVRQVVHVSGAAGDGADALLVFGGQSIEQPDMLTLLPLQHDEHVRSP